MVCATEVLIYVFLAVGVIFNGLGSIGLVRFPDLYTRLHTATKATTFGSIFLTAAVVAYGFARWGDGKGASNGMLAFQAIAALLFLLVTNPTGAHAIARAAHRSGVKPWGAVIDQLAIARSGGPTPTEKETDIEETEIEIETLAPRETDTTEPTGEEPGSEERKEPDSPEGGEDGA